MSNGRNGSKDDFWDIEKLVPRTEKPRYTKRQEPDISAVEIVSDSPDGKSTGSRLTFPSHKESVTQTHTPQDTYVPISPLINKVKIYKWNNNYNYYEDFRRDAIRLLEMSAPPCPHKQFFSYVPQYVQLDREQLSWYLYFRDCVRHGNYPDTDYSYIVLLIYEIINLGELADVKEGQQILCELHKHYRQSYSRLDRYLGEWICDYSLIHRLPPPLDFCTEELAESSSLKEFYVYFEGSDATDSYAKLLMKFCSAYDYTKSKFAVGENLEIYEKHIPSALSRSIGLCSGENGLLSEAGLESNMITRDAYTGALCASEVKRRLEIEFCSFSRSHELRFLVADIIKYSENKIRAYLGIKSKLSVFGLPNNVKNVLDTYFSENLPSIRRKQTSTDRTAEEYEKLYDAPKTELSFENAEKIEEYSWNTTGLLIDAFDSEDNDTKLKDISEIKEEPCDIGSENSPIEEIKKQLGEKYYFIIYALNEDFKSQRDLSSKLSLMIDALADEINDLAADILGDIILEENDGGYTIIEDYRELF